MQEVPKNKVTRETYEDEMKKVTPSKMIHNDIEDGNDEDLLFSPTTSSHVSKETSTKKNVLLFLETRLLLLLAKIVTVVNVNKII